VDDSTPRQELILNLMVVKQAGDKFIASISNVTDKVMLARKNMIFDQTLKPVSRCVDSYVIFTTDVKGIANSWNDNAQSKTGVSSNQATGTALSLLAGRSLQDGETLLKEANTLGSVSFKGEQKGLRNCILNVLKKPNGDILGY